MSRQSDKQTTWAWRCVGFVVIILLLLSLLAGCLKVDGDVDGEVDLNIPQAEQLDRVLRMQGEIFNLLMDHLAEHEAEVLSSIAEGAK